jgi:hypothetical protein
MYEVLVKAAQGHLSLDESNDDAAIGCLARGIPEHVVTAVTLKQT